VQDRISGMGRTPQVAAPRLLNLTRSPSLAEQAAEAIVTGIASGALKPGQRLVETELAGLLDMSRVPLREALRILEAQGIVESTQYRGKHVTMFDDEKIDQICEARIALERIALRGAVMTYRRNPERLACLDRIIVRMEEAARRRSWLDINEADLAFHREICMVSGNTIVTTLWEGLARHVLIVFGQEIRSEKDADVMAPTHRRLLQLLAGGDIGALESEIEKHILRLRHGHGAEPRTD
jgi:DNA-binding GntR family transcriptional regulator